MGGMACAGWCSRIPSGRDAVVLMDTSPGPPPGIDPELVVSACEVRARAGSPSYAAADEFDPLGSAAYQRVLAERPGFREFGDRKWSGCRR